MENLKKYPLLGKQGFSLVELLVVIAIIAILSVVAYTSFSGTTEKAADSKNLSNMDAIANAVEIYKVNEGAYPDELVTGDVKDGQIPKTYLSKIPQDPSGDDYLYVKQGATFQVAGVLRNDGDPANFSTYVVGNGEELLTPEVAYYYDENAGEIVEGCVDPVIVEGQVATAADGTGPGEGPYSCLPYNPID